MSQQPNTPAAGTEPTPGYPGTEPVAEAPVKRKRKPKPAPESEQAPDGRSTKIVRLLRIDSVRAETRAGVAILLSFLVLLGVFVVIRNRKASTEVGTATVP